MPSSRLEEVKKPEVCAYTGRQLNPYRIAIDMVELQSRWDEVDDDGNRIFDGFYGPEGGVFAWEMMSYIESQTDRNTAFDTATPETLMAKDLVRASLNVAGLFGFQKASPSGVWSTIDEVYEGVSPKINALMEMGELGEEDMQ